MHKVLFEVVKTFTSKFIDFLVSIWKGSTGDMLDRIAPYVNEVTANVDNMKTYVIANKQKPVEVIKNELIQIYGYAEIDTRFVEECLLENDGIMTDEMKTAKLNLVLKILKKRLKLEKIEFIESIVMLSIQLIVNSRNNK